MMRRWQGIGLGLMIIAAAAGCETAQKRLTLAELEQRIREDLQSGMGQTEVLAFLDAGQVKHSAYITPQNAIYVRMRHPAPKTPEAKWAEVQFWFNSNDGYIKYTVRELTSRDAVRLQ